MHRNRSVANSKDRREYEKMALAEKMSAEELAFAEMLSRILQHPSSNKEMLHKKMQP